MDPACGDGECAAPYEFPEYSRFGCKADCGLLKQIQKLTRTRVSIEYDFSHPPGTIPSAVRDTSQHAPSALGLDEKSQAASVLASGWLRHF